MTPLVDFLSYHPNRYHVRWCHMKQSHHYPEPCPESGRPISVFIRSSISHQGHCRLIKCYTSINDAPHTNWISSRNRTLVWSPWSSSWVLATSSSNLNGSFQCKTISSRYSMDAAVCRTIHMMKSEMSVMREYAQRVRTIKIPWPSWSIRCTSAPNTQVSVFENYFDFTR